MRNHTLCIGFIILCSTFCLSLGDSLATPSVDDPSAAPIAGGREEDLLKWALRNSNPDDLQKQAKNAKKSAKEDPDAADRIARAAELMAAVNAVPTEAALMVDAIEIFTNTTSPIEERSAALEALAVLVEPIDNADHLLVIGGAAPLVAVLGSDPALEAGAARVLAVAASNNAPFQNELLEKHPDVMLRLVALLGSTADDTTSAALLAAGSIIRNSPAGQKLWAEAQGSGVLLDLAAGGRQATKRTQRRALSLATDLLHLDHALVGAPEMARAVTVVLEMGRRKEKEEIDLQMMEKALLAAEAVHQQSSGGKQILDTAGATEAIRELVAVLKLKSGAEGDEFVMEVIQLAESLLQILKHTESHTEL